MNNTSQRVGNQNMSSTYISGIVLDVPDGPANGPDGVRRFLELNESIAIGIHWEIYFTKLKFAFAKMKRIICQLFCPLYSMG